MVAAAAAAASAAAAAAGVDAEAEKETAVVTKFTFGDSAAGAGADASGDEGEDDDGDDAGDTFFTTLTAKVAAVPENSPPVEIGATAEDEASVVVAIDGNVVVTCKIRAPTPTPTPVPLVTVSPPPLPPPPPDATAPDDTRGLFKAVNGACARCCCFTAFEIVSVVVVGSETASLPFRALPLL